MDGIEESEAESEESPCGLGQSQATRRGGIVFRHARSRGADPVLTSCLREERVHALQYRYNRPDTVASIRKYYNRENDYPAPWISRLRSVQRLHAAAAASPSDSPTKPLACSSDQIVRVSRRRPPIDRGPCCIPNRKTNRSRILIHCLASLRQRDATRDGAAWTRSTADQSRCSQAD